jgi:O-antigen ligase
LGEATGTYINRNHFAGFMELTIPLVVAAAFYSFQLWSERRHAVMSSRGSASSRPAGWQVLFYVFLLVIMSLGVVFSGSRAGVLSLLLSIVFIALLAQLKARRKIWMVGVVLFMTCIVGYGLWIGLDPLLLRFEVMKEPGFLQTEGRIAVWKDGLHLVRDYPLMGTGLGTFGTAFRQRQTAVVDKYVDRAHNDYLEVASETGLFGVALLFLPILYLFVKMVVSFLDDRRRYRRSVTLGCIGSILALLIHSVTDFNLQIPANALVFGVVLGIGYKAACIERREEGQTSARVEPVQRD